MTKITDLIWLGNSKDAEHADLRKFGISAILNVAHDLQCRRGWSDGLVYAQCGLVDGPGSTMAAYHSAVLQLASLTYAGGRKTLVCDHEAGGRAMTVIVTTMNLCHGRLGWEHWLGIVKEKSGKKDFEVKTVHRDAFNKMNWRLLSSVMEG